MKRKIIAAIFTGMLITASFPAIAHAEIENPEDYMGIWYANYVMGKYLFPWRKETFILIR